MDFMFFVNSVLLGVGLAMDAFSVSIANGLKEKNMNVLRMSGISLVYAFFQFAMPLAGWICVHTVLVYFKRFEQFIPWIALILLSYIGGKMIFEGIRAKNEEDGGAQKKISFAELFIQGVATSIDALSVGFTIADYNFFPALISCVIIAVVTFFISFGGLAVGKTIGAKLKLNGKAAILGGSILIFIGIEIFVKRIFFN